MKKILGIITVAGLLGLFLFQVTEISAHKGNHNRPVTSPLTSPACKPGFGFGDKNHCHEKKEKHEKGHDNDRHENRESHHENHGHH